jgi:ATP-binding cassette subfamily B protein
MKNKENKKKSDKVPVKEAAKLTFRGYRIIWDKYPMILISSAVCAVVAALTPYVGIYLSAQIINEIAGERSASALTRLVVAALVSAAALSMLRAGLSRWKNCQHSGQWYKRNKINTDKLLAMDFCAVDDPNTHDLLSQINQNDQWSGWGLGRLLWNFESFISSLFTIAGAAALSISLFSLRVPESAGTIVFLNNPIFIAVIISVMLAVTFISPLLSNKTGVYWAKHSENAKMGNRWFCFFGFFGSEHSRALDVRMYRQDIICKNYNNRETGFGPKSQIAKYARGPMGALNAASTAVSHIFTALIYVFVCLKSWGGAFGVGSVTQYIGAISALSGGISSLVSFFGNMRNNAAFLKTTFEFLDIPNAMYQGTLTTEKRSDKKYEIEFKNVSFKYPSSDKYALRDVSLKFNIGQRLAVVGQNGSGKTTFIKLLCRLYDPTEGEIRLNGIDIRKYDYLQYMDIFSVVFQDFKLLSFSLGQNVAAAADYDAKKAGECLGKVGFGERLQAMEKHLDTCLYKEFEEDGVEISGGEAQKIALARALYKEAPFIILDEPTAALDPVAEFEVYSKMDEIAGDKTAVFISHRLSSCRFCQDIAVFHEGALIQRGGHDALIADESGEYFKLWTAQSQYYQDNMEIVSAIS